jgi:hypothetical protein
MKKMFTVLAISALLLPGLQASENLNARFGINLYQLRDWNRQQPYINLMKLSRPWISQRENQWDSKEPLELDENGYVKDLQPGQWAATVMLTESTEHFPGGEYILLYEGEGEFEWKQNARLIESLPGREVVEVTPQDKNFIHMILKSVNPDDYPRNMRFFRKELEDKVESELFTPEFLALWKMADTFRFMDWTQTNTSKQREWNDRPLRPHRTYFPAGAPWEDVIDLCNQIKKNAWINIPHLASDDYIRKTAEMFRDNLDPSLKTYFEFSNEVWNGMFPATRQSEQDGVAAGLAPEGWKAGALQYGKNCVRMFAIVDEVYKDVPRDRFVKVVATQAANIGFAKIVVEAPGVADGADVLAIAPYVTFNVPVEPSQWQADMPIAAEVESWDLDQVFDYLNEKSLPQSLRWMDEQMELAKANNLGLTAYEGGQHLTALGEANRNQRLVALLSDANRDPRMGEIYTRYLNHWTEIGGGLFCIFNDMQPFTNAGSWGLLEHWGQPVENAPKMKAVLQWAETLPR